MATKARPTTARGGARGGNISLADEDREYINESLSRARGRVGGAADIDEGGLFEALERFGLSSDRVDRLRASLADLDVRESVDKASEYLAEQIENARDYTRDNPRKVIGGAAGVLVGASLLALAIRRAAGEESRRRIKSTARKAASTVSSKATTAARRAGGKKVGGAKKSSGAKKSAASSSGAKKSTSTKSRSSKRR